MAATRARPRSANGYNIHDVAGSGKPAAPEQEQRLWYQYYFHTERGRAGLTANRRELCKFIWRLVVAELAVR